MNLPLLRQTVRWQRTRFLVLALAAFAWGWLIVTIFTTFSPALRQFIRSNPLMEQFSQFGSGNFFSLPGALTLGFQHPLLIAIFAVIAAGSSATAIAGERQTGTLELMLARPLSRQTAYLSILVALLILIALLMTVTLLGMSLGIRFHELGAELEWSRMPLVLLNGFLLWAAFTVFGLAASVSFNRPGPALGLSLAYLLTNYFLEIIGSLWNAARWTQRYSLLHRFNAEEILTSAGAQQLDLVILAAAVVVPLVYALIVFPRRDIPAPS